MKNAKLRVWKQCAKVGIEVVANDQDGKLKPQILAGRLTLDRLLGILGIVIGFPGFLLLFLTDHQTIAILGVVIAVVILAAAFIVRYTSTLPPFSMKSVRIHLDFPDKMGKRARLSKSYRIVPNYGHLKVMTHKNIAADGGVTHIKDIRWNDQPVPVSQIKEEMGEYVLNIEFPFPLRRWREVQGKLSYEALDSFNRNPDGLVYVVDFPSRVVNLQVDFPWGRKCTSTRAFRREGAGDRPIKTPTLTDDGKHLELTIRRPRVGSEFIVWWDW